MDREKQTRIVQLTGCNSAEPSLVIYSYSLKLLNWIKCSTITHSLKRLLTYIVNPWSRYCSQHPKHVNNSCKVSQPQKLGENRSSIYYVFNSFTQF